VYTYKKQNFPKTGCAVTLCCAVSPATCQRSADWRGGMIASRGGGGPCRYRYMFTFSGGSCSDHGGGKTPTGGGSPPRGTGRRRHVADFGHL
jgi:hypothetical protein